MKTIFLIGGTMGVGKTTVCQELKRMLPDSVFLDGDWCWDASPFYVTEETKAMVLDNICHVLNNFIRCSAYQTIIFAWVMHEQEIIDAILKRLDIGTCDVKCISLVCDEETLRKRLQADIEQGRREPDVVGRSVSRLALYGKPETIKLDTTSKTVWEIVQEILML